jgi:hypothetical protein
MEETKNIYGMFVGKAVGERPLAKAETVWR